MTSNLGRRISDDAGSQLALDWSLDPLEARVMHALYRRVGREMAIRVEHLAQDVEADPREVQHIVKRLREQHGAPILSTAGKPSGYFLPASLDEVERCILEQKRKAISTLRMLRALKRHRARLQGQQEIAA